MRCSVLWFVVLVGGLSLQLWAKALLGQEAANAGVAGEPVTFTTREDHRNMMEQLGITKLRPGPSGNATAANAANYDEALANPYPNLPEALVLNGGERVTTAEAWWKNRRPEIVEDFEREVLGRVPKNVPAVTWTVVETKETKVGETAAIEKQLQGKVDNALCPAIEVNISMTLVTPKEAKGKVPVLMMFGGFGFGGPRGAGGKTGPAGGSVSPAKTAPPAKAFVPQGPSKTEKLIEAG